MVHSVPPPALGSRQPGASALAARATAASRMPRRFPPLGVPPRCHEPNAPSRHGAHAKLPCTGIAASSALLVLLAAARGCVSSARRAGFAAKEGSAAREAAFRIELRAPASPARCHRRAGVRAERAVAARRASGHAVTLRPPDSRARARSFAGAAPAVRRLAGSAACGGCAPPRLRHWHWNGVGAAERGIRSRPGDLGRQYAWQ